jgi:hypothetical protein
MSSFQFKKTVQDAASLLVLDVLRQAETRKTPLMVGVKIGVLEIGCVCVVKDTEATTHVTTLPATVSVISSAITWDRAV